MSNSAVARAVWDEIGRVPGRPLSPRPRQPVADPARRVERLTRLTVA